MWIRLRDWIEGWQDRRWIAAQLAAGVPAGEVMREAGRRLALRHPDHPAVQAIRAGAELLERQLSGRRMHDA